MSSRAFRRERERRIAADRRRDQLRLRRAGLAAGAAIGAFALGPQAAQAANFEVNTLSDAPADGCTTAPAGCTLRDAMTDAAANTEADTITFQTGLSGTLALTTGQQLETSGTNPDNLTIQGPGAGVITISGDADDNGLDAGDPRILDVRDPSNSGETSVAISGLTMSGGNPSAPGGAIYLAKYNNLDLSNTTITGNATTGGGGAIGTDFLKYSDIHIANSTISGNDASTGGAIQSFGALTIDNSTLSGNHATTGGGGAIAFNQKYAPLEINNSVISGNTAGTVGGGIVSGPVTPGGPVSYYASDSTINDTTISGNTATNDGGGFFFNGLYSDQGSFTVDRTTISGNNAGSSDYGGGIGVSRVVNGKFRVVDSTISGNSAGTGAGVSFHPYYATGPQVGPGGSIAFDNSTIAANTAATKGGGLYLDAYGPMGGPYSSPTIPLNSTITGDNSANGAPNDLERDESATTGGFSLAFSLVEAPSDGVTSQSSSIFGTDPQLAGLANNGGPTFTQLPSATSPALDAGNNPLSLATDQRGQPRTVDLSGPNAADGTDIGAVEREAPAPAPVTPAPSQKHKKCKKKKKKHKRSADSAKKKHKKCKKKKKKRH